MTIRKIIDYLNMNIYITKTSWSSRSAEDYQVLVSKAIMVLRFIGCMYFVDPVINVCTISLLALSDGWKGSQNAYTSLFGHKFDKGVHSPIPLYGPCPQHATFDVTNPAKPWHSC